jgi:hypothetical protein
MDAPPVLLSSTRCLPEGAVYVFQYAESNAVRPRARLKLSNTIPYSRANEAKF